MHLSWPVHPLVLEVLLQLYVEGIPLPVLLVLCAFCFTDADGCEVTIRESAGADPAVARADAAGVEREGSDEATFSGFGIEGVDAVVGGVVEEAGGGGGEDGAELPVSRGRSVPRKEVGGRLQDGT